ncbi:MAG: ABC transporter permease, partial [Gammaproteobacteria bacterium]|nr:ABC transporter permease [Gammaproteobacteria bacterium]
MNDLLEIIRGLGRKVLGSVQRMGRGHIFLYHTLMSSGVIFKEPSLLMKQLHSVGVLSIQIIAVSGLTVGMVLSLQGYNTLVDFGAEQSLGQMVALSLV